ncbi:31617_t:CDS:2, partial [Gigaspora margarita]
RNSLPSQLPSPISPIYSSHNVIDDSTSKTATRSLLNLLNSERAKRKELQKDYDSTAEALRELQQKHHEDVTDMENDIQVLRDALVKESKANSQLSKLLRETRGKFLEDMKSWESSWNLKVSEMEAQGKELQKAFDEAWNHLEKEEREVIRLREENEALRSQLNNRSIDTPILNRLNLENVRKVGYLEDRDDLSVSTDPKHPTECNEISDTESVANYSKISDLTDHRQLDEQEKKITLLRASNSLNQKTIETLRQDLRKAKFNEQKQLNPHPPRPHTPVKQSFEQDIHQSKRKILAEISNKERKNSMTSTNSGSIVSTSNRSGSVDEKYEEKDYDDIRNISNEYVEGEHSDSEEEDDRDDQSSSLCTSSEVCAQSRLGSEEATSVTDPHTEYRCLPLRGHFSAAEFTEDEDYIDYTERFDDDGSISRRHSMTSDFEKE